MLSTEFHPKPKVCAYEKCGREFLPARPLQQVCGPLCAHRMVRARSQEKKRQEREAERKAKEEGKNLRRLLSEAQEAFNEWVRLRDADKPCIACGDPFEPNKPGGSMDAGHFRARSVAPQLRFEPDNVFGQHKDCNRPGGTVYAHFRAGVIARVGLPRVEELEANNTVRKWTKDDVRQIRDTYRAKVRALKEKQ